MIQITQLKLPISHSNEELEHKIRKTLKINDKQKLTFHILKRSIDARKKPELLYVYTIEVVTDHEKSIVKNAHNVNITIANKRSYQFPQEGERELLQQPIIVGAGPAGLFCAYLLTMCGYRPMIFERGKKVSDRTKDVLDFWKTGILNPASNVQFGEGGAGTFSDGKLNTAVKDANFRNQFVLETFVYFGAPEQILYDAKPHIGTDILSTVIENMRNYLIERGAKFIFETQVLDFVIEDYKIKGVICNNHKSYEASVVVLALGHSARDTFKRLNELNVPMEAKNFAVGYRVEHPQNMIDLAMYGKQKQNLPAAAYKLTANFENHRGVYSFCMCPGGYVVNSSSYDGGLVVNGMSYSKRDSANANSAIIVSVGPNDFEGTDALSGMRYQQHIEKKAFELCKGKIPQQLYGDYVREEASKTYGTFSSMTKGDTSFANLRGILSESVESTFINGMNHFEHIIPGFSREDAILSGIESRTSSPIRIHRDENFESEVKGIYPCGEGAGYAGGIMSAAMDGIKVAEAIINRYKKPND